MDLGAHVSAVAGVKNGKIDVSLRCVRQFTEETGINLGKDIATPLGEFVGGVGGGHAMAAGVSGTGEIEPTLKQCLKLLKNKIAKLEKTGAPATKEEPEASES